MKKTIWTLLILISWIAVNAGFPHYQIGVTNHVYQMEVDSPYIWAATADGLWRVDPYHSVIDRFAPDGESAIIALDGGPDTIWCVSRRDLISFCKKNGQFKARRINDDPEFFTTRILRDSSGTCWIGTNQGLICCRNDQFLPVTGIKGQCYALAFDSQGTLYCSTTQGISMLTAQAIDSVRLVDWSGIRDPLITVLTVDDRDRVCLAGATTVQIYENGECIFMCELDTITWGKTVSSLTVRDSSIWFGISYSVNDLKGFPFLYHIDADTITPVMVDSTFGVYDIGFLGDATVLATPTGIQWMTAADTVIVRLPDRLIHPSIPDLIANDSLLFIAQAGPLYQINSYNRGISIYNHSTDRWSVTRDSYGIFRLAVLGQYTAALNQDSKIYLYQNDRLLYRIPLDYYSCNDIAFDPDTNLWVLSTEGILFKGREELNFSIHPYTRHLLGSVGDRYDLYTLCPVSSREVYVSTPNGLYEFHPDSVKIYDPSNSPLNDPFVTAFGLTSDRTLYIGTHSGGLYRKRESLIEPVNLDSPNNDFGMISHINQDPEGIIWVSTMGKGIYYSHDNQWTHLGMENRELPVNRVTATARIGRDLYLGTMSDGLWILDLTTLPVGETLSDHHESSVPLTVKAYPNPFTSVIHLEILRRTVSPSGVPDDPVCLQIRNLIGQMVLSKIIDRSHSSDIRLVWNGRNQRGESLPSGIYLYRINAGEWITSGRLTHLK